MMLIKVLLLLLLGVSVVLTAPIRTVSSSVASATSSVVLDLSAVTSILGSSPVSVDVAQATSTGLPASSSAPSSGLLSFFSPRCFMAEGPGKHTDCPDIMESAKRFVKRKALELQARCFMTGFSAMCPGAIPVDDSPGLSSPKVNNTTTIDRRCFMAGFSAMCPGVVPVEVSAFPAPVNGSLAHGNNTTKPH